MSDIPLSDQVHCLKREISKRNWFYPKMVKAGKMTVDRAELEIAQMEAAKATLEELAKSRGIDLSAKGDQLSLLQ